MVPQRSGSAPQRAFRLYKGVMTVFLALTGLVACTAAKISRFVTRMSTTGIVDNKCNCSTSFFIKKYCFSLKTAAPGPGLYEKRNKNNFPFDFAN